MLRLVLGILKGAIVGAAVGYGAWKAGLAGGAVGFVVYGLVGALVGVICGKPLWRQETLFTPLLKSIFGFAVGVALFYGARKILGGMHLGVATGLGAPDSPFVDVPFLLGPLIGLVYGAFVEVDDGSGGKAAAPPAKAGPTKP
ncbi:MAG TPA: hypothetical protein VFH68_24875 [Polyangia bacterium]|jgi:hypothetical protein|nr:hypothetical protein [Polyangia bacterium]